MGWIVLGGAFLALAFHAIMADGPALVAFFQQLDIMVYVVLGALLIRRQAPEQAAIAWLAVKISFGMVAVGLVTIGAPLSFLQSKADAWPNLFLGLIWLPGPEFVPALVEHQKWITFSRAVLSLPCIYFGVHSGEWSW